jgi:hypothetical protein
MAWPNLRSFCPVSRPIPPEKKPIELTACDRQARTRSERCAGCVVTTAALESIDAVKIVQ